MSGWWSLGKPPSRRGVIRAAGIAGAGSFAPGGGQVSQRPDQGSNPPQSVVAPTQAAGTLRARQVIVFGTTAGVYLYSPAYISGDLASSYTEASASSLGEKTVPGSLAFYDTAFGQTVGFNAGGLTAYSGSFGGGWSPAGANINMAGTSMTLQASLQAGGFYNLVGPSGDATGAADTALLNNLATGEIFILVPGTYYINAPITIPDQSGLLCLDPSWGIPTGNYGFGGLALQGAVITPVSGFSGAAALTFNPSGDATAQHGGQRLYGITLNGNSLPGGNTVDGIKSTGYVAGVKMRDVTVFGAFGGTGLHLVTDGTASHVPDFWQLDSCKFSGCHTNGVDIISLADSWFVNCEATGNTGVGWKINNSAGTRMIGCRGNNNATGINWSGLTGFTANYLVAACEFASNTGTGIIVGGTGSGLITLDAVDANSNGTQYSYSGTNSVKSNAAWNTSTAAPTFL